MVLTSSRTTLRDFQLFIQAPVLLMSTLRQEDVEIGQHSPFCTAAQKTNNGTTTHNYSAQRQQPRPQESPSPPLAKLCFALTAPTLTEDTKVRPRQLLDDSQQAQNLTINALKKLSLSPLPMVSQEKRVTPTPAPYQPATVDLSLFPLLTRQPNHKEQAAPAPSLAPNERPPEAPIATALQQQAPVQKVPSRRDYHSQQVYQAAKQMQQVERPPQQPAVPTPTSVPSPVQGRLQSLYFNINPMGGQRLVLAGPPRHLQQINGLRLPMYVPAVLRVTQSSNIHDMDELYHRSALLPDLLSLRNTPPLSNTPLLALGQTSKCYEDIMRAPPTRKHWLKDETVEKCMIPQCPRVFNFFDRRHHCRKCGGIFCKDHTLHFLYINHLAQFTTGGRGTLLKVCDRCIDEYSNFILSEFGPALAPIPAFALSQSLTPVLAVADNQLEALPHYVPQHQRAVINGKFTTNKEAAMAAGYGRFDELTQRDQLVGLVPANWSWSSF